MARHEATIWVWPTNDASKYADARDAAFALRDDTAPLDGAFAQACDLCGVLTPTAWLQPELYQEWDALCPRCFCRAHAHSWSVHARDQARRDRLRQAATFLG